jgi:calcium/calmodulin-dependent protein kinase (CaM kinase) II
MSDEAAELLALNQKLLTAIVSGDWATYAKLCDPGITCFEPEARGQLVTGLPFHQYYFPATAPSKKDTPTSKKNVTMCAPSVRVNGDMAVLAYVRLTQYVDANGAAQTAAAEETRIWERKAGAWKHIHFHRSPIA